MSSSPDTNRTITSALAPWRDPGRSHRRAQALASEAAISVVLMPGLPGPASPSVPGLDPWRERLERVALAARTVAQDTAAQAQR